MADAIGLKRKEIEAHLNYIHVAAHMISRGILTLQEHRAIMNTEEINRVSKLLDIIQSRDTAFENLIDAMEDPDWKGDYDKLVESLKETSTNVSSE